MIRNPSEQDYQELQKIHEKFFSKEFPFDDFLFNSISNFVIIDDSDGGIISAGSIRPIAEIVAITNLDKSVKSRRFALYEELEVARYVLKSSTMRQLHAFVQDQQWEIQLIKSGFARTKGNALYINV